MVDMNASESRATQFEAHRPHLRAVATRLLGSASEAEDAVQEAWFRFDRARAAAGDEGIVNLGGWLTTVVSRICLDHLRTRSSRGEVPDDETPLDLDDGALTPEDEAILSEEASEALAVVIDRLSPLERVTFVLHDVFDVPFEQVAAIVDRSPVATRQLASRARKRARAGSSGAAHRSTTLGQTRHREIVAAFFAASKEGRLDALIQLLAPGVVLSADATTIAMGAQPRVVGARAVAETFSGRAHAARLATIDGMPGGVWAPGGNPRIAFRFTIDGEQIVAIDFVADPEVISALAIVPEIVKYRNRDGSV